MKAVQGSRAEVLPAAVPLAVDSTCPQIYCTPESVDFVLHVNDDRHIRWLQAAVASPKDKHNTNRVKKLCMMPHACSVVISHQREKQDRI